MKTIVAVLALGICVAGTVLAQGSKYPPLSEYMMEPEAEIALARSAAPENISAHATIKVLSADGYKVAAQGDNGFVCLVMRGWSAPNFSPARDRELVYDAKLRAPICFDPVASRTVLPMKELRTKLGMEGKDTDAIVRDVAMAYAKGELPKMEAVAFAYMWSADQVLGPAGAWHPHMMIFAPYYTNKMLGDNACDTAPCVADDSGTPFALIVVPVHGVTAIKSKSSAKQKQ